MTKLFGQVLAQAEEKGLTSDEHFSVDGTVIEPWTSMKSFRPNGARRLRAAGATPRWTSAARNAATTPMRVTPIRIAEVTPASGQAEREAAVAMLEQLPGEGSKALGAAARRQWRRARVSSCHPTRGLYPLDAGHAWPGGGPGAPTIRQRPSVHGARPPAGHRPRARPVPRPRGIRPLAACQTKVERYSGGAGAERDHRWSNGH